MRSLKWGGLLVLVLVLVLVLGVAAESAQPVALDGEATLPRPAVIVLWASWCVPCRAELKRLAMLAQAAQPLPLVTLALDPPEVARGARAPVWLSSRAAFADARAPAIVLEEWGGKGAALPLAVALDRTGAICGRKRGPLGTDQLRDWAGRCLR